MEEKRVGEIWNANAEAWAAGIKEGADALREFVTVPVFLDGFLPDLVDLEVIDLGCAEGRTTRHLALRGARMTGVDLSSALLDIARRTEDEHPLGIRYEVESFTSLSAFPDESFDVAVSNMAFMDGPDFPSAARAAYRVLRPGGGFFFNVFHPCFWMKGARWILDKNRHIAGRLIQSYWDTEPYTHSWEFRKGMDWVVVPRFHHRLETYINGLCDAGFILSGIREPRPTDEMVAKNPAMLTPIKDHAPILMCVSAMKPK